MNENTYATYINFLELKLAQQSWKPSLIREAASYTSMIKSTLLPYILF